MGVNALFIERGGSWENGYIEAFDGKLRDELLNREAFNTLTQAKVLIDQWRREYNQFRPHSALRYQPPAPEAILVAVLNWEVVSFPGAGDKSLNRSLSSLSHGIDGKHRMASILGGKNGNSLFGR